MVNVQEIYKDFEGNDGQRVKVLNGINLNVEPGELFTLLGPSGCGKTTTLRCIAGLESPDKGVIAINGQAVFDSEKETFIPSNERNIGMVFQSYAIWPHMDVFENVAFPLRVSKDKKYSNKEIREKVMNALEIVQLSGFEKRSATQLSGGQQQRLALARALVREPNLILLDEPLSNLDAKLRETMRIEVKRLQLELGVTTIYVTHDQAEALALSDKIAIMHQGNIIQIGDPKTIYTKPKNRFVAEFIGTINFIEGIVESIQSQDDIRLIKIETDKGILTCLTSEEIKVGQNVIISIRPENIKIMKNIDFDYAKVNVLQGKVTNNVFLGDFIDYIINIGKKEILIRSHPDFEYHINESVNIFFLPEKCTLITF